MKKFNGISKDKTVAKYEIHGGKGSYTIEEFRYHNHGYTLGQSYWQNEHNPAFYNKTWKTLQGAINALTKIVYQDGYELQAAS